MWPVDTKLLETPDGWTEIEAFRLSDGSGSVSQRGGRDKLFKFHPLAIVTSTLKS
jgi:hypothetical protein